MAAGLLPLAGMLKLNSGFGDYSADGLAHLGVTVGTNLPTLPIFSTLKPTPALIDDAAEALRNAIAMIGPGRKQAIDITFAALAKLLAEVAVNAPQVTDVTDVQLAEIGLPVAKTRTRYTTAPGACQNLRIKHDGNPGVVIGRCQPMKEGTRFYETQWTLDPNGTDWTDGETTPSSRGFKWTGLPRGKDVWFRVRAVNAVGPGAWSDPATIMVM